MTKAMVKEVNAATGKEIEREATAEELKQMEADKVAAIAKKEDEAIKSAEKTALLERLGITAEEAALLLA
jgi:hypothetical protein